MFTVARLPPNLINQRQVEIKTSTTTCSTRLWFLSSLEQPFVQVCALGTATNIFGVKQQGDNERPNKHFTVLPPTGEKEPAEVPSSTRFEKSLSQIDTHQRTTKDHRSPQLIGRRSQLLSLSFNESKTTQLPLQNSQLSKSRCTVPSFKSQRQLLAAQFCVLGNGLECPFYRSRPPPHNLLDTKAQLPPPMTSPLIPFLPL